MSATPVRPFVSALTELDAREILAKPLLKLCSDHGPTGVGKTIGCDEKTVRNARDEKSTMGLDLAANLLLIDGTALDGFLARVGRRSVPVDSRCDTDTLPAMTGAVHRLAVAASPSSPSGAGLSDCELLTMEGDLRTAFDALGAALARIDRVKAAA